MDGETTAAIAADAVTETAAEAAAEAAAVDLRGVHLSYPTPEGELPVLHGIDMTIERGEIVAVMGPSGSGKSSLIAMIGGLERATSGTVRVLGRNLQDLSEKELTRLRRTEIGIVFQAYHLIPAMTAVRNVSLPLMLAGAPDAEARAQSMLERVGLGTRLTHRPSALSGGEQQRVAVARAFLAEPQLILADEPTGNLDQSTGRDVADTMFGLIHDTGAAMLLVTHDPKLAEKCDRTISIDSGRIKA